jgi:hypothetical protein
MKRNTILSIVFLLITCTMVNAADFYAHCYWVTQGTRRIIVVNLGENDIGTEFQVRRMESGKTIYSGTVVGDRITIKFNTPGHDVIYARTYKVVNGIKVFGDWMNSLQKNNSLVLVGVDWTPRPWVIIVPTAY